MGSSPQDEARFLARSLLMLRTLPYVKGMWWYDFSDDGVDPSDPESNFGIVANNLTPKPAYLAMRDICRLFAEARYSGELDANPDIRIMKFCRVSGEILWVVWSINDPGDWEVTFANSSGNPWNLASAPTTRLGNPETESEWKLKNGVSTITVKLSGMPLIIDTGNADIRLSWNHANRSASLEQFK
jgi:hypothetical protein